MHTRDLARHSHSQRQEHSLYPMHHVYLAPVLRYCNHVQSTIAHDAFLLCLQLSYKSACIIVCNPGYTFTPSRPTASCAAHLAVQDSSSKWAPATALSTMLASPALLAPSAPSAPTAVLLQQCALAVPAQLGPSSLGAGANRPVTIRHPNKNVRGSTKGMAQLCLNLYTA